MAGSVAVFGGGVGGLTAAHELAVRGFEVAVHEARERFGGKARSYPVRLRTSDGGSVPGEHGFRFFPGFYWHLIDTMGRIPDGDGSVEENLVSTEETLIASVHGPDTFESTRTPDSVSGWLDVFAPPRLADAPAGEALFFAERVLELLTSCRARREEELEHESWWDFIEAGRMSELYRTHVAGSTQSHVALRPELASARTMGHVYVQLVRGHLDPRLDAERVLNGPTSEVWIDPWVELLEGLGVDLRTGVSLRRLHVDGGRVSGATVDRDGTRERVEADYYVAALPVRGMARLVDDQLRAVAPSLRGLDELRTGWMSGLQFYLDGDAPIVGGHQIHTDSPWALTAVSQQQFWEADLGERSDDAVSGVLSVIVSDWNTPGVVHNRPARDCAPEEIREEVWTQLTRHLNREDRTRLREERVVDWSLDPAIEPREDGRGVENADPLFVNSVGALEHRPPADVEIPNLVVAGDYVRTNTDLASMEGANEAARRAVNAVLAAARPGVERCEVREFPEPAVFEPLRAADRVRYRLGLPHPGTVRRSAARSLREPGWT